MQELNAQTIQLSEREKSILRSIIQQYILHASPVGSRNLSRLLERELKLSPATIRNVMSDLEAMELISHPHTSAGRVPTDKGYRLYVDSIMDLIELTDVEIKAVQESISGNSPEMILKEASRLLGFLSHYLGIVEIPLITNLIVEKIELIELSSNRLLIVLALDSNIVRTLTLEAEFEIDSRRLAYISQYINEKISGKPLRFLKDNFLDLIGDSVYFHTPLVRLFIDSLDKIFELYKTTERIHIAGAQSMLSHPEFEDLHKVKGVIELIESEDMIIHILDQNERYEPGARVFIGSEMQKQELEDFSLIVSGYSIGSATGSIGLIGPKRMNYSKMLALVQYVANVISKTA